MTSLILRIATVLGQLFTNEGSPQAVEDYIFLDLFIFYFLGADLFKKQQPKTI